MDKSSTSRLFATAAAVCVCFVFASHVSHVCANDAGGSRFRLGLTGAFGAGGFHGHLPIQGSDFEGYSIIPKPSVSVGAGLAAAFRLNGIMTLALEPQYAWYGAGGQFTLKKPGSGAKVQHEAEIGLHCAELPVTARFGIGPVYTESGIYTGLNISSPLYKDNKETVQRLNTFACGIAAGLGMEFKRGFTLGLRWQYSLREYVEDSNGYPWSIRAGITKYLLNKNGGSGI